MSRVFRRVHESLARRFTTLLVGSAIGVYVLLIGGATTAALEGATACSTWPACNDQWLIAFDDPVLIVAWLHRVTTLLVGVLLVTTAIIAQWADVTARVRRTLWGSIALYPIQIGLGALTVTNGAPVSLATLHLVVAVVIFTTLLLALLWRLEAGQLSTARSTPVSKLNNSTDPSVTPDIPTTRDDGPPSVRQQIVGYIRMTKPKLWWLLCLVAVAAMGLAAGPHLDLNTVIATLVGGILAIAASGTFNNILERDIDRKMDRTADRPLAVDQIPVRRALGFGIVLSLSSVAVFLGFVNIVAAGLGVAAILFYSVGYTLILKPNTTQNIVLGGAVGGFPALIGWAAVENTIGIPAVALAGVIFLWTPAHFYNLALAYRDDYTRAGIPMLPVIRGAAITRRHILLYLGATMIGAVLLGTMTGLGWLYAVTAAVVGAGFLWAVVQLHREQTDRAAFRAFHASNVYLGGLLLVIIIDTIAL